MNSMNRIGVFLLGMLFLALSPIAAAATKTHPLFTPMQGYGNNEKRDYEETAFDAHQFRVQTPDKKNVETISVEGKKYEIRLHFDKKSGVAMPSPLQVIRNHADAIRKIGGKVLYEKNSRATLMLEKGGQETWVEISISSSSSANSYILEIIEKQGMQQDVQASADIWAKDISATGRVAIYGVHFDTGKADIKPESDAALAEMAKLLGQNSQLKVHIVGHTDNVGDFAANMKLSQARAESVRNALIARHRADGNRISAHGASSLSPVASNATEEGRAQNRRVEMVEQ